MSLPSFLACFYLVITIILLFKRKRFSKMYMLYGGLTFLFVICYPLIVSVPKSMQGIMLFITFSIMILLFGLTFAIICKLLNKSDDVSRIVSIIASLLLIVFLFKVKAYFSYLWIPVLLYKFTDFLNKKWVVSIQ